MLGHLRYSLLSVLLCLICGGNLLAQDAYHTALQARLMSEYDLPAGDWVLGNTEAQVTSRLSAYGAQLDYQVVTNQDWTQEARLLVAAGGNNPWDAGYICSNAEPIQQGDKLLWTFQLRSEGGGGQISLLAEQLPGFAKEIYVTVPTGINWTTFYVAIEATLGDYAPGELNLGFHLAHQQQDIRVGGFTMLNYGDAVELEDLPSVLNNENYNGSASDAAWRGPAAARIEQLRKADVTIRTLDTAGERVANVDVQLNQQAHEFAFGSAMNLCRINDNNCFDATYVDKFTNLDGRGHGFNWMVPENDLKWDGWESEWFITNERTGLAVEWLRDRGIKLRGHNLVWPGADYLPDDVAANVGDTAYVMSRIRNHINTLGSYPGLAGNFEDWDVLNETVTNTTIADAFQGQGQYVTGREFYGEVFREAGRAFPDAKLYLNDYITISASNGPTAIPYITLKRNIQELLDSGAPINGIGFQAHIGATPNGIPSVLATLDDFYDAFGLEAKMTEFDMPPLVSDTLAAKYLTDFLRASFSHPSMTGFTFWNFWDVDTYMNPQANLFREDWSITPAGEAFVDLIYREWWTDANLTTNASGSATQRAFKGAYTITYNCGGEQITEELILNEDSEFEVVCDEFVVSTTIIPASRLTVFPNPTTGAVTLQHHLGKATKVELVDVLGRTVWQQQDVVAGSTLGLAAQPGRYVLLVYGREFVQSVAVVIL